MCQFLSYNRESMRLFTMIIYFVEIVRKTIHLRPGDWFVKFNLNLNLIFVIFKF